MDQLLADFQARADQVTEEYGIPRILVAWEDPSKKVRHLGVARLGNDTILINLINPASGLSRTREEYFETVNHELAHFVAWRLTGDQAHGRGFKKYAKKLGSFARARVGTVAQEQARDQRAKTAKTERAKNRKEHAAGHEPSGDCHLCRREVFGSNIFRISLR